MKLHELRRIRTDRGYSQEYMGNRLGISQRHYGRLESGERTLSTERFVAICTIIGADPSNLIQHVDPLIGQ